MRIGVLSDTHNYLDPKIGELFMGADHILHAGDVGLPWLLLELEQLAPVTAVLGNTDAGIHLRETELCEFEGRKILIHHIVNPEAPAEPVRARMNRFRPDIVVFGHTHQPFEKSLNGTLFLNPGYAGKPRFAQHRSAVILHLGGGSCHAEFLPL